MTVRTVLTRIHRSLFSHWLVLGVFFVIGMGIFSVTQGDANAFGVADIKGFLSNPVTHTAGAAVGAIAWIFVSVVGGLLFLLVQALLLCAQYNDFISSPAVSLGWIVMRDMANMFFVFVLLAIAIGTILQKEQYSYRKLLPGFIMAAILVNFSKTITGFIIDVSQVIMNTFVAAFASTGGGNFAVLLGIPKYFKLAAEGDIASVANSAGAMVLAMIFTGISVIVVGMMTFMLVMRIVGLWFMVVLSPWAFMLSIVPRGEAYAKKWWSAFTNLVILGPVMAFFLWLSLAVVAQINEGVTDVNNTSLAPIVGQKVDEAASNGLQISGTEIGSFQGVLGYLFGIAMLLGTIVAASELGKGGGAMAAKFTGTVTGMANGMVNWGAKGAGKIATGKMGPLKPVRDDIASRMSMGKERMASKIAGTGRLGQLMVGGRSAELERQNKIAAEKEKQLKTSIDREMTPAFKGLSADDYDDIVNKRGKYKNATRTQQLAALQQLADKGKLTDGHASLVSDLSKDLKGTEMGKKLDETLRTKNWDAAFETRYKKKDDATGEMKVDTDKLLEHLYDGKISLSQLNEAQRQAIIDKDPNFINTIIKQSGGDAQKLGKALGSLSSESVEHFKKKALKDADLKGLGGDQLRELHKKGFINAHTRNKYTYTKTFKPDGSTDTLDHEKIIADAVKDPNLLSSMKPEMTEQLIAQNPDIAKRIVSGVDDPGQIKKIFGNLSDETKGKFASGLNLDNTKDLSREHKEAMVDTGIAGHHLLTDYGIIDDVKEKGKIKSKVYTDNAALGDADFVKKLMEDKDTLPKEKDIQNMDAGNRKALQGTLEGLLSSTSASDDVKKNARKTLAKVSQNLYYGNQQSIFDDATLAGYLSTAKPADLEGLKNFSPSLPGYNTIIETIARQWNVNNIKKLSDDYENRPLASAVASYIQSQRSVSGSVKEGNFSDKSWNELARLL